MTSPKVSICIPSYNLARFLGQAIEGVFSQSFQDWELLIEDDGSSDESAAIIGTYSADPRVSVSFRAQNLGANATTNNLVRKARGEYIALLAADDVWEPAKLATQVALMEAHPEASLCMVRPSFIDEEGKPCHGGQYEGIKTVSNGDKWKNRLLIGNAFFASQAMYRRSVHNTQGYFDEALTLLADLDFWHKCMNVGQMAIVEESLCDIRIRSDNLSKETAQSATAHVEQLDVVRTRHRQASPKFKLAVCTPFYESRGWSPYITSIARSMAFLASKTQIEFDFWDIAGDSYVWRARNSFADRLVNSDFTHLMFIDSDMGWDQEGFQRVVSADVDIVGAAYPVKNNWEHYGVQIQHTQDAGAYPLVDEKWGTIKATWVPTGFMKISRTVFDKIREMEPENWYWAPSGNGAIAKVHNYFGHILENHTMYGEDISFCKRASAAGCELHVEPRASMTHMGVKDWNGRYYDYLCRQPGGSASENPIPPEQRQAA